MESNLSQDKRVLRWLAGGHFVNDIYTGMLNPIMPFIAVKIGISMAVATVILTVSLNPLLSKSITFHEAVKYTIDARI